MALVEERTNAGAVAPTPAATGAWWSRYTTAAFFMGPALVLVAAFFVAPVIITLGMSLTDMATATGLSNWQWVGLDNYERMTRGSFTLLILGNTIFYVVVTLAINVLAGLGIALLSTNVDQRVGGVFRALWLLPRISPSVVYALMWTWAAAAPPYGVINQLVEPFGVEGRYWINSDPWLIVFLINGFVGASFGMLIFTSAIKSDPRGAVPGGQGGRRDRLADRAADHAAAAALADPLRADLPDDEPVRLVRVHPADDERRPRACT